jgi:hypothetical protein
MALGNYSGSHFEANIPESNVPLFEGKIREHRCDPRSKIAKRRGRLLIGKVRYANNVLILLSSSSSSFFSILLGASE